MSNVMQLGLWLVPESGGTYKSVKQFHTVLNSKVYSCTFKDSLDKDYHDIYKRDYVEHCIIKNTFLGKHYSIPEKKDISKLYYTALQSDILISHSFWRWGSVFLYNIAKKYDKRLWIVAHGSLDPYVFSYHIIIKKIWFYLYGIRMLNEAEYVICASTMEMNKIKIIAPNSNCVVVNWPIEKVPLRSELERTKTRCVLKVEDDERMLLYLGRLHPMKRIVELITVFHSASLKKTKLVIAGPGDVSYIMRLYSVIKTLGLQKSVLICPPVYGEEKQNLLFAADCYISNSARENFGLAGAEALAAGLPVILSRGNDLGTDLRTVECGWILCTKNVDELKCALIDFSTKSMEAIRAMGENGRRWTQHMLSHDTFIERIKLLESGIAKRGSLCV